MGADEIVKGIADPPHRIQHVHGALRDVRNRAPLQVPLLLFGHIGRVHRLALEMIDHFATNYRQRRLIRAQQNTQQG